MTVHFIGAGPGAADLITLRGLRLIQSCPVCLYAGSLVPGRNRQGSTRKLRELLIRPPCTSTRSSRKLPAAHAEGDEILARVHSGDPSIYGAIAEQMRRLDQLRHRL